MNPIVLARPLWSTASFGEQPDTLPMELSALEEHFDACQGARGRWFALRSLVETTNRFVAARFVTTLVLTLGLGGLLIGIVSLVT
jgi:hypothetical protein